MAAEKKALSVLIKAWKERWTPLQWLVEIRKTGDNKCHRGLAECLIQQSTFGSTPNSLILSYLQHGITAELIPCSDTLIAIQQFQNINKHRCLTALLNLMLGFVPNMSCPNDEEESLKLAVAMLKAVYWLLIVAINLLKLAREAARDNDVMMQYHINNTTKCLKVFAYMMGSATYKSLIIVGKMEEQAIAAELDCQFQALMKEYFLLTQSEGAIPEIQMHIKDLMINFNRLHNLTPMNGCSDRTPGPLPNLMVQTIIQLQNTVYPTDTPEQLADVLESLLKVQNITRYQLYLESIRAALVGLLAADSTSMQESLWTGFFIFKLPKVFSLLESRLQSQAQVTPGNEHGTVLAVLQQLKNFTPLLNEVDQKCSCDIFGEFIHQYSKYAPPQVADRLQQIADQRESLMDEESSPGGATYQPVRLLIDAETRVRDVLQVLEAPSRSMDDKFLTQLSSLFSLMHSRWKMVAVASMGRMQGMVAGLIRITKETEHPSDDDEDMKSSELRGDLFNAAFIILCHIGQVFGRKVIVDAARAYGLEQAFVTRWISSHIPECDKSRTFSPDAQHKPDPATVTLLLQQFFTKGPFTGEARWDKLCLDVPNAMHEMLKAAQFESQGASPEIVQKLCESIKYEVPAWAICICAWCCGHTNALRIEEREFLTGEGERGDERPVNPGLLGYLLTPMNPKGLPQTFTDRCSMMLAVMREMVVSIERKDDKHSEESLVPPNSTVSKAMSELLVEVVKSKSLDIHRLHKFKRFLILGGPRWFCRVIIKEMLALTRQEDMNTAADVGSCLMFLDADELIPALLCHAIPTCLRHGRANVLLQDPKGQGLARLAAHTLELGWVRQYGYDRERGNNCDIAQHSPSKMQKMDTNSSGQSSSVVQDALVLFCEELVAVVGEYKVGPVAGVLRAFLQQTANCTNHVTGPVLACLPTHLTQKLLQLAPVVCSSPDVILGICSMQNTEGRKLCAGVLCQGLHSETR
ncbi:mediator of RNA polymerase II transcription subunit 24 [Nematostella vectensis]|uniref:mediator of RNA polymerase II transcription subunit 24 n=1 Tax=Nematostella vectensis TaxID=45351 RepID=UPI002077045F|nr:mediator of RNA polymerase II transcription subunit 24 [Nematostella vectensis]